MRKSINSLIIGAGKEQIYFIKEAKKLGINIIALDESPIAEGLNFVDIPIVIDIKDENKVIEIAKKYNINFVLPAPIGNLITVSGAINNALKLKGSSKNQAEIFANKDKFTEFKIKNDFYNPKEFLLNSPNKDEIKNIIEKNNSDFILRPAKGSGSRGVVVIKKTYNEDKKISLIDEHLNYLIQDEISLIGEFVNGKEYGVDIFISDEIYILAIREKIMTKLPYRQEVGFIINNNSKIKSLIKNEFLKLSNILNLNNTFFNADVIINKSNIFIIEASPRPAGLDIYKNLLGKYYKKSIVQECFKKLIDENHTIDLSKEEYKQLGFFMWDIPNKTIKKKSDFSQIDDIIDFEFNLSLGEKIPTIKKGSDINKYGYFILKSDTKKDLKKLRKQILKKVVGNERKN
ncbi:ATP-grasp domain-containing protein [Aliarcobacter butzleri]|uniref:ATP-grasp domain-containing protein n=1 Tax=Aliarcobacter butzleri TaxID=28197 RepID=UPI0021B44046|nr:ATP-grasp domain-containing protein [Aliarcobacter butzleri]MCT7617384.1 ATP-grasp domain-containing protein [Aliarcobacter butzleri]